MYIITQNTYLLYVQTPHFYKHNMHNFILLNIQVIILLDHITFLAEAESFSLCQPNQFYSQMTLITNG